MVYEQNVNNFTYTSSLYKSQIGLARIFRNNVDSGAWNYY